MRSCHFFPESTSSNKDSVSKKDSPKVRVSGILELACKDAGFQLVARNKDRIKNGCPFHIDAAVPVLNAQAGLTILIENV
jgi:hypothetical protein